VVQVVGQVLSQHTPFAQMPDILLPLYAVAAAGPLRQDLYKAVEVSSVDAFQVCWDRLG
jgi:hypothetical protein